MLEKIINSFLYGNSKTKIFLWSILLVGMGALFLLLAGLILGIPSLGAGGVVLGFLAFIISQSVSLKDLQKEKKRKPPKDKRSKKIEKEAMPHDGKNEGKKEKERAKARYLSSMDDKKLKKEMKAHKVPQIHVKVMIDSYPARQIEQAPAFMWRTDTMLHFMALTDTCDEFEVPLQDITGFLLVKNVPVDTERDYLAFRLSNFISKLFQPYLPEYHEHTKEGRLTVTKNTFQIEPGIYLTNSSVANLKKVLLPGVAFLVDDSVMASKRFNAWFKELYCASLLCKNLVITLDEYKEQIEKTLDDLVTAPIQGTEFVNTLYNLKKYRLITQDNLAACTQKYRDINLNKN